MKDTNLYNKEINFLDLLLIIKHYSVMVVAITIILPLIFFIYSYSGIKDKEASQSEYKVSLEIFSYPLLNKHQMESFGLYCTVVRERHCNHHCHHHHLSYRK